MNPIRHCFTDLDEAIDGVHQMFDTWQGTQRADSALDQDTIELLKIAVHEWIANLVQHARFEQRQPEIHFSASPNGHSVHCTIDDNSDGFDLNNQLKRCAEVLEAFPERGMGLLMLQACAEDLSYGQTECGRNRLSFIIPGDTNPWLNIPF